MSRLIVLTCCTTLIAVVIFFLKKRAPVTIPEGKGLVIKKEWLVINKNPLTPQKDLRPPDQTFLTYPEWFLVFSPAEQADYFKHTTATSFPYMSHTKQIWQSYKIINDQIRGNFPKNTGYHFMIWVIGSSASVEYSFKALYETLIGRLTDTKKVLTEEDKFNATYTQDYVDFIRDKPWYAFDFKKRLKYLWKEVPFFGDHFLRKIERRYILTSELVVKYIYGKLIGIGTKSVYEEAVPTTAVIIEKTVDPAASSNVKNDDEKTSLLYLPRYDKFGPAIMDLAKKGYRFKEIAGNTSAILITVLVPAGSSITYTDTQTVFTQPVASDLTKKRIAFATPVASLNEVLLELDRDNVFIEHVFDY